jgi:hypothetical protein
MRRFRYTTGKAWANRAPAWAAGAICAIGLGAGALAVRAQGSSAQEQTTPAPKQDHPLAVEKPNAKAFPSPAAAAAALANAARENDTEALLVILGPGSKDLVHWSADQDEIDEERSLFAQKYDQMHRLVKEPDDTVAVYVGAENWPLPIPLVEYNGAWYFDGSLGKQEILYRRIGRNEIAAMDTCNALVDAEKEYFGVAHAFTAKFVSSANAHDGLYWKSGDSNTRSPVGPYLANAGVSDSTKNHASFHGYFYRIVLRSPAASAKTNNFFVVAFPAEYRSSGVMTFFVDEKGDAYQKDLGPETPSLAMQLTAASLDNSWKKAE